MYYRWHPLFGQTLRVIRRVKDRDGEHVQLQLQDHNVSCLLPAWMFSPECLHFTVGPPLISVAALAQLREVLNTVHVPSCDKNAGIPSQETMHEATAQAIEPAIESLPAEPAERSSTQRTTERTGASTGRSTASRGSATRRTIRRGGRS